MSKESKKSKHSKGNAARPTDEAVAAKAPLRSFCDVSGPWETKKISIFGAVRSVISQLRNGQDMTRVSLPACFLAPLSALEVGSSKFMGFLHVLYELRQEEDSLKRFILVLRWYLACYCEIKFNHKPYNPVINESHQSHVTHEGSTATYISEQVTHHPPLSAFHITNPEKELTVVGNISFTIKFGGNSASCESKGEANVTVGDETYHISKGMPDVLLTNVVIGTRVNTWNGEIDISCPKTGYRAHLKLSSKDSRSFVDGHIFQDAKSSDADKDDDDDGHDKEEASSSTTTSSTSASSSHGHGEDSAKHEPILVFSGHWAEEPIHAEAPKPKKEKEKGGWFFGGSKKDKEKDKEEKKGPKHLVIDPSVMQKAPLALPGEHEMEDTDSLLVWRDVSLAITGDDLTTADVAKTKVEAAQRVRIKAGAQEGTERRFFSYNSESQLWLWNGRLYNGTDFLSSGTEEEELSATLMTSTLDVTTTGDVSEDDASLAASSST